MSQNLTKDELQQLEDFRKQAMDYAAILGELSYQEVLLSLDKVKLTDAIRELKEKERVLLDELGKKYGNGSINLETGEIQPTK